MQELFLGCDWGTSSFRLRLFDMSSGDVIGEITSEEGIAKMHNSWLEQTAENNTITKVELFRKYLKDQVSVLSTNCSVNLDHVAIIISGMASSSIGMEDVPYAKLPFAVDGSDTSIKRLTGDTDFPHDIILISGVRSENDVMRGEETQLIGLLRLLEKSGIKATEGVFIFPGTHSKHIQIRDGQLVAFNTFMTGELFNIISNHSILKNSIEKDDNGFSGEIAMGFKRGVQKSKETGILNGLFTVRTNQLFEKLSQKQNAFYLSGLLIGEELNHLAKDEATPLILCSGSNLFEIYRAAINELGLAGRTTIVATELVDKAALEGHYLVFEKHILNKQQNE